MRSFVALILTACAVSLAACSNSAKQEPTAKTSYGDDAQAEYERGLVEFKDENCLEASPIFQKVRRDYPYSRFAALADLRIADCLFNDGEFSQAVEAYRQFVRLRPSNTQVPYARYQISRAFYKDIPKRSFLSPPSYERDQQPARDALTQSCAASWSTTPTTSTPKKRIK
ncbi:MAG: outer membrane protein assembly factor BamD [Polyangiales bacterium]